LASRAKATLWATTSRLVCMPASTSASASAPVDEYTLTIRIVRADDGYVAIITGDPLHPGENVTKPRKRSVAARADAARFLALSLFRRLIW